MVHLANHETGSQPVALGSLAKTSEAAVAPTRPELRILLIEDSVLLQQRLTEMLTEPGVMQVAASAATEREAKQQIDAASFDVLLVDVELGEGSGIGAISHARAVYGERQPLIIVLTNFPLPAVRRRCLAVGADHFLDKMRQFQDVKPLIAAAKSIAE